MMLKIKTGKDLFLLMLEVPTIIAHSGSQMAPLWKSMNEPYLAQSTYIVTQCVQTLLTSPAHAVS